MSSRPKSTETLKPVTGTYTVPKPLRETAIPSHVFDIAWRNAIHKAEAQWGKPNSVTVAVEYRARIDLWNPGGIGWCSVKLTPGG